MKTRLSIIVAVVVVGLPATAGAALITRGIDSSGNRLIYDDDLDITWYDSSAAANTWAGQMDWASALSVDFNGIIYDDWRLPVTDETCFGYTCASSEMGHLYYTELGNSAGGPLVSTGPFQQLMADLHWSGTPDSINFARAWYFGFADGFQFVALKDFALLPALAVRDGDVASAPVPEPAPMLLFVSGLAGLAVYGKKKRRRSNG